MPDFIKDGGVWKPAIARWIKDAGIWKPPTQIFKRQGGIWKPVLDLVAPTIDGVDFTNSHSSRVERTFPSGTSSTPTRCTLSFFYERTDDTATSLGIALFELGGGPGTPIGLNDAGQLSVRYFNNTFGTLGQIITTAALFPGTAAGVKHVVATVDTTQPVAADRLRLWVDGVEITAFSTDERANIVQDQACGWFGVTAGALTLEFGGNIWNGLDSRGRAGYCVGLDGIAVTDPTQFTDSIYSGSYGQRGWHWDFENPNDLGNDISGNTNHGTVVGLSATEHINAWETI